MRRLPPAGWHATTMQAETLVFCAAGKSLEDIIITAEETSALAKRVREWVARAVAICLQHRTSRVMYTSMVGLQRSCSD